MWDDAWVQALNVLMRVMSALHILIMLGLGLRMEVHTFIVSPSNILKRITIWVQRRSWLFHPRGSIFWYWRMKNGRYWPRPYVGGGFGRGSPPPAWGFGGINPDFFKLLIAVCAFLVRKRHLSDKDFRKRKQITPWSLVAHGVKI